MEKIMSVDIGQIEFGEKEQRSGYDEEGLDDLAASIGRIGLISPIVVVVDGDKCKVVAGHRRLLACRRAGLKRVEVRVVDGGAAEETEVCFAENLFREDLTPVELAAALSDAYNKGGMGIEELAVRCHRSAHWVQAQVGMMHWPGDVLEAIHGGIVSVSAGANLALVLDENYRKFLIEHARESGATARSTAAWLQAWRTMQPVEAAVEAEPVDGIDRPVPACPQAPCLCCGEVKRMDALSHVPVCPSCIQVIRNVGRTL